MIRSFEWDRTLLDLSSKLTSPFCETWRLFRYRMTAPIDPKIFENKSTRIQEISFRCLAGIGAGAFAFLTSRKPAQILGAVAGLGIGSKILRALGFAIQKNGYTHVQGSALEKPVDSQIKLMTWNICGLAGGFSLDHGGLVDWRFRIDSILETIREENPDVLVLQEVVDTALAETLIEKLQNEYAHFFIHLGKNVWGVGSGCMVIAKCPIHDFSYTPFSTNTWELNRGFASFELKKEKDPSSSIRIIGTHLLFGGTQEAKNKRITQVAEIVNACAKKILPTVVAGDFNIERDDSDGEFLKSVFVHGYLGDKPTCTNTLAAQWNPRLFAPDENIDYISVLKGPDMEKISLKSVNLNTAFESDFNTQTARSDHHALVADIDF